MMVKMTALMSRRKLVSSLSILPVLAIAACGRKGPLKRVEEKKEDETKKKTPSE